MSTNPLGMKGIAFVEFAAVNPTPLERLFLEFGFSKLYHHHRLNLDAFTQNQICFLLDRNSAGYSGQFATKHGPSIPAMGLKFEDAQEALRLAVSRGAKAAPTNGLMNSRGEMVPAIFGIGESLIYFLDGDYAQPSDLLEDLAFKPHTQPIAVKEKGFISIDHLTNNVENGQMQTWADFYKKIFGFTEVRYFDIKGVKTGLTSYALKSPCGTFCIPINEAKEEKSQINEYLREYRGPGIQHLAFLTNDILASLDAMKGSSIETLDIDPEYYTQVFDRVKHVKENHQSIQKHKVLVDGDDHGYLLQIFTRNLIGPIFIELIQRNNHYSFGEGNFGALFRSIERDQEKRGVFQV